MLLRTDVTHLITLIMLCADAFTFALAVQARVSRVLFSRFMLAGCSSNTSEAASDTGAIYTNGLFVII